MRQRLISFAAAAVAVMSMVIPPVATAASPTPAGYVYVATNDPKGNAVVEFRRADNGALTRLDETSTDGRGGTGNGVGALDPLGSQNSLVLVGTGLLLVVNAGSDSISSLAVKRRRLSLVSTEPSGGTFPNSIAVDGSLVYVLNGRGTPNVQGFRLDAHGVLNAIPSSKHDLPGGFASAPHDVRFSQDGTRLIVSEGGTNQIDIFELGADGRITGVVTQPATGSGPFGFTFGRDGVLLTTEANSASLSSQSLGSDDTLMVITGALTDGQMATCWLSLTRDGKFAFVSNTGSGTLSSYEVSAAGALTLSTAVAASVSGSGPIDSALSDDGAFLYVDDSARGRILTFAVRGASLTPMAEVRGLPATIQGIAAQ